MGRNRKRRRLDPLASEQRGQDENRAETLHFSKNLPPDIGHYEKLKEVPWHIQP